MKNKSIVFIRETDCIGCAKCIDACPVDAIVGSPKQMHTVIADECIGCDLCLPPCPVDCIDLIPMPHSRDIAHTRARVQRRKQRLQGEKGIFVSPDSDPGLYIADILRRINRP